MHLGRRRLHGRLAPGALEHLTATPPPPRRPRVVAPHLERRLQTLRQLAHLLDGTFRIPGTRRRFGWDPLLGLVPWVGDAVTLLFGAGVLVTAVQLGVPRVVQARILITALADFLVGLVPIAGDAVDFVFRANARNMDLLERHAYETHSPAGSDWLIVATFLALMLISLLVPLVVIGGLLTWLGIGLV